jgi:hypothetical protein
MGLCRRNRYLAFFRKNIALKTRNVNNSEKKTNKVIPLIIGESQYLYFQKITERKRIEIPDFSFYKI